MSFFIPIPKKSNDKESSSHHTIVPILQASKEMPKILQARLQQYMNQEHSDVQAVFQRTEKPEIKLPAFSGSWRKQGNSRKTSASLTTLKPLTVWMDHKKLWKILKEVETPDYLTCLLRNLYTGQETAVTTRLGATDWFKLGKGVTSRLYIITLLI